MDGIGQEVRQAIAQEAVESAVGLMHSLVVNAGQESLVSMHEDFFWDQIDAIAEGEFEPVDCTHPDAIGEVTEAANEICEAARAICEYIKAIEQALGIG